MAATEIEQINQEFIKRFAKTVEADLDFSHAVLFKFFTPEEWEKVSLLGGKIKRIRVISYAIVAKYVYFIREPDAKCSRVLEKLRLREDALNNKIAGMYEKYREQYNKTRGDTHGKEGGDIREQQPLR